MRSRRQGICQHAQALRGAFPVRGGSLLHGAAAGIEWRRTLQMRRISLQPLQAAVVQMREDGRDCTAMAFLTPRLGAPRTGGEMGEDELVQSVVALVGFGPVCARLSM